MLHQTRRSAAQRRTVTHPKMLFLLLSVFFLFFFICVPAVARIVRLSVGNFCTGRPQLGNLGAWPRIGRPLSLVEPRR